MDKPSESLQLQIAERKVLSNIFPTVDEIPEVHDYKWRKQSFVKDEVLFKPGLPCDRFMLLGKGNIRIELQNSQARSIILYRLDPGQLCIHSLINLMNDKTFSYIATAESDGWFCWAEKEQFNLWMQESNTFQNWIFNNIGTRFKQVVNRFANHVFVSTEARLAELLIERMDANQMVKNTQGDLARELGTAREMVSRHLSRWQKQEWIQTQRGGISILQIDALLQLSE